MKKEKTFYSLQLKQAFEQYSEELFRHCLMRLSERERALELTQETFLRAFQYAVRSEEEVRQWRSFLYRILNNLIVDEYRRKRALSLESLLMNDERANETESALLRDDQDVLEEATVRYDAARACEALELLPERYRDVLRRRFLEGLSPTEIAKALQESENAVSVRIHRALRKLREQLEPKYQAWQ
jgi:RNA polymerase sigma-70 factor, ECF subfamily